MRTVLLLSTVCLSVAVGRSPTRENRFLPKDCNKLKHDSCGDLEWSLNLGSGLCYKVLEDFLTWDEAVKGCRALGGSSDLATITSPEEQRFITKAILEETTCPGIWYDNGCGIWIGMKDLTADNKSFQWVTGAQSKAVTYANWYEGEPNNVKEECVALQNVQPYQWWDAPCDAKRPALCVKKAK